MSTTYTRDGATFWPSADAAESVCATLPGGNYVLGQHPMRGWFLERTKDHVLPQKMYGNVLARTQRVLTTFIDRPAATGVLLAGLKGSGKTMQASAISAAAALMGHPTILINQPCVGDPFMKLLQDIEQPKVILFDEFEKVYHEEDRQKSVLTLFDGVFKSKTLFLLTVNDRFAVSEHMRDRPGRLYYSFDYDAISKDFIREYCGDVLKDKSKTDGVVQVSTVFYQFNFDMLKAVVEEMNRYGEEASEVVKLLNMRPSNRYENEYAVTMTLEGLPLNGVVAPTVFKGHPLRASVLRFVVATGAEAQQQAAKAKDEVLVARVQHDSLFDNLTDDHEAACVGMDRLPTSMKKLVTFTPDDLCRTDVASDSYAFRNSEGYIVTLTLRDPEKDGFSRHYGLAA